MEYQTNLPFYNPAYIKTVLTEGPRKSLGQHFLISPKVVKKLANTGLLFGTKHAVEIGPGMGTLTYQLASQFEKVTTIEYDPEFIPLLKDHLGGFDNIQLIQNDALQFDYKTLPKNYVLISSLPYQITSPFLHTILQSDNLPNGFALLIQKEVALKMTAKAPKATYWSNFIGLFGTVKIIQGVPKGAFWPPPKVDSAIVQISIENKLSAKEAKTWSAFLHKGFKNPRKVIKKAFDEKLLVKAGVDPQSRPANLTLQDWQKLKSTVETTNKPI